MSIADLLPGRFGLAARLPGRIEDLHGPVSGIVTLPRHLSWPGLRECDLTDPPSRQAMYGLVLSQGKRNDVARLLNAGLLRQDWQVIGPVIDARLRRRCERQFALVSAPAAAARAAAES